jgi:head-tail adaptor
MSRLPDGVLTRIRAAVNTLLPTTAIITAVTETSDGQGGFTDAWLPITGGTVSCRIDPVKGQKTTAGAALVPFYTHICTFAYDTTISAANRIVVGSATYIPVSPDDGKSWNACKRVYIEKAAL